MPLEHLLHLSQSSLLRTKSRTSVRDRLDPYFANTRASQRLRSATSSGQTECCIG